MRRYSLWHWWSSDHFVMFLIAMLCYALSSCPYASSQLQNQPPHFIAGSGDMARFTLSENTPVGSPVYQLKGEDPEGSRLKYSISGPVFSVDRETGVVRLRQELDRETQDTIEVIISITDEGIYGTEPNTVSLRRVIPVRDYNDNQPMFIGRPYAVSVSESLPIGAELEVAPNSIRVLDSDKGINAEVTIKCVQENDICDTFSVQTIRNSEGNYTAKIILKKPLDFESRPTYIMSLAASDGALENRLTAFASVSISVIDVQDQPPIFTNAPYSATVAENTEAGVSILTIKAIDGDIGIPRSVFLSLEDESFGYFVLEPLGDPKEGTAVLKTTNIPIDRENPEILQNGGVYVFAVRVTELIDDEIPAESAVAQVTIVVTDVDDHIPEFNEEHFNISIPENLGNGMALPGLSIVVNDRDMGEHSEYALSLRDVRHATDTFAVHPEKAAGRTPVVLRILDSSKLDFDVSDVEKRTLEFDIIASVKGMEKAKARVTVHLLDANDNAPIFEKSNYRFAVAENATIDQKVGSVTATDKDSDEYGTVAYVLKGFGSDYFYADQQTGDIFVRRALDYERQSSYSLTIVAIDGGGKESNANVQIDVTDINDNYPQFENNEYSRTIREGTYNFEPQFFIRAIDLDGLTQGNGRVRYDIVSENSISGNVFRIDSETGEVTLQKLARSMDTERGEYELVVSATDFGNPPLKNTTRIFVRVGISGNQRPIFRGHFQNMENLPVAGPPSYRVSIPENAETGYNVTTVTAHDPDGLDSLLRYRIIGANDNFLIDEVTGVITVSPQAHIDRDSNMDSFEITVNAVDAGMPIPETATATVYVNIKDINDEKPKFEQSSYAAYVSERTAIGQSVLRVHAIDRDLNSKLQYSLSKEVKATTKSGVNIANRSSYKVEEAFRIDSQTGEIFVNNSLRHDVAAVIILMAEVRDLNAELDPEGQFDITEVTIYVQSFKDTNPVFLNAGWSSSKALINVTVKEEMPIDSALFILEAEDPVTNLRINNFQLVEPTELEYFEVQELTGEVKLRKRLDYEALQPGQNEFLFQVRATSQDNQRSTVTQVKLSVENVNDNSPHFEKDTYYATIIENKKFPEKVTRVQASDKDAVLNARDEELGYNNITYSLQGENAELFEINQLTGDIVVAPNRTIDRERTPQIHLQVKAEDSPGKPADARRSIASLHINVLDVNDNKPVFNVDNSYTAVVPENVPKDTLVMRIMATDADDGPGGEVRYELVNEGEVNGLFKINVTSGELRTKRALTGKGRAAPYKIVVRAQDNGNQVPKEQSLFTDVDVSIYIGDVSANDGIPAILSPKMGQTANISENSPVGSTVFQVIASDPDDPKSPAGLLTYNLLDDTPDAESFAIDAQTGLITTSAVLDREEKSLYNVILEVSDNGQPRQSVTRILQINVLDVDDHKPRFDREVDAGPLVFSVLEEEPEHTIVGNFTALDEDIGDNALIDYVISEGNEENYFTIERNNESIAILKTTRPIDRELVDGFTLTIKCFKFSEPAYVYVGDQYDRRDLSQIRATIKIIDIDDNLPKFEQKDTAVAIRINVPIDTVVTTIHATDSDAEAPPIVLTIDSVKFVPQFYKRSQQLPTTALENLFTLHNRTGELRTGGSFADYVDGYFEMKIRANNSMKAKRHSFQLLKIFVIRDKSLLKFVFARPPSEIQAIIRPFQEKLQSKLKPLGLELHLLDTQVLTKADASLDFTASSACFQMFKNDVAIGLKEMQKLMNSNHLRQELLDTYVEYGVSEVESCSARKLHAGVGMITSAGVWLVILAGLIGLSALAAACTACCLKRKLRKQSKHILLPTHTLTEPYTVDMPTMLYSEPMYGPL